MAAKSNSVLAWHFLHESGRLQYDDNRKPKKGRRLRTKSRRAIMVCQNGMHASKVIGNALKYAPGAILCRVKIEGEIAHDCDKLAGRYRTILEMIDFAPYLKLMIDEFIERAAKSDLLTNRHWGTYYDSYRTLVQPFMRGEVKTLGPVDGLSSAGILYHLKRSLQEQVLDPECFPNIASVARELFDDFAEGNDEEWLMRRFRKHAKDAGLLAQG